MADAEIEISEKQDLIMRRLMNRQTILCVCLLLTLAGTPTSGSQTNDTFKTFWQQFKAAVIKGDKQSVASLSRFPIAMSYGKSSIKTKAQLMRRYREVFDEQTNAAQCFAKKEPEKDAANPKDFSLACPDEAGNEVVVFSFSRTKTGWKFVGLDNLNE